MCPECGATQLNPAIRLAEAAIRNRTTAASLGFDLTVTSVLALVPPTLALFQGLADRGYNRLGVIVLGFPFSIVAGGVIGLVYAAIVLSRRLRAGLFVKKRPLAWACLGVGAISAFIGMLFVAVVLVSARG